MFVRLEMMIAEYHLLIFLFFVGSIDVDGRDWNIRGEPGEVQIQLWQPAGP